jgi:hypothetical protein
MLIYDGHTCIKLVPAIQMCISDATIKCLILAVNRTYTYVIDGRNIFYTNLQLRFKVVIYGSPDPNCFRFFLWLANREQIFREFGTPERSQGCFLRAMDPNKHIWSWYTFQTKSATTISLTC